MRQQRIKGFAGTLALGATLGVATDCAATNGYFSTGYGTKATGMGGVAIALPQDSLAAVNNPAGIAWLGDRVDAGFKLFNPNRDATLDASGMYGERASADSGSTLFLIPHAGLIQRMGDLSTGLVIYANGGLNTRYNTNLYADAFGPASAALGGPAEFPDSDTLGVNLAQLTLAPTVALKLGEDHSVGASLLVGYQTFRAYGLGIFSGFSNDPANLTNNGNDDAWGLGLRLGWTGKITDRITLGVSATSKTYMQEFDEYSGLFAEQGDFDIPANYGVGIAFQATPRITLGFDVVRTLYSDVRATGNSGPTGQEFIEDFGRALSGVSIERALGTDGGYGYGWDDQTVYKLGIAYVYNTHWTFRFGLNYGETPFEPSENLFNIVSLAVVEKHVSAGFTYAPDDKSELTLAYVRALEGRQSYTYEAVADFGAGPTDLSYTTELGMDQHALEISYAWKF
ncbi:MAG TPA: outer membrane protein transport protein [Thiohalobacter sp.]|nr:outer membrane protein transport protein [Thiohalobacter sp.]